MLQKQEKKLRFKPSHLQDTKPCLLNQVSLQEPLWKAPFRSPVHVHLVYIRSKCTFNLCFVRLVQLHFSEIVCLTSLPKFLIESFLRNELSRNIADGGNESKSGFVFVFITVFCFLITMLNLQRIHLQCLLSVIREYR